MNPIEDMRGQIYRKDEDIVSRKIAGELFLVPIRGNLADMQHIFTLNLVAEYIWEELDGKSLGEVREGIMENFEVGEEQADTDIRDFIASLLAAGLIKRTS